MKKLLELIEEPDTRLHDKSSTIHAIDENIKSLMQNMLYVMHESSGIGLAAIQIGVDKRVIVIDSNACLTHDIENFEIIHKHTHFSSPEQKSQLIYIYHKLLNEIIQPLYMINPIITWASEYQYKFNEGCLSFPGIRADITRHSKIKVNYLDSNGHKKQILTEQGLFSVCIQHEIDHINGIVFTDRLSKIKREFALKKMMKYKIERDREVKSK